MELSSPRRLTHIEGLRGYLALWVLVDHVLGMSGYTPAVMHRVWRVLGEAEYAVDVFIMISGFVIFLLLDRRREGYRVFVVRRFFRLWPLFIVMFACGIALLHLRLDNLARFVALYPSATLADGYIARMWQSWWDHLGVHIAFHLPMLHGMVPHRVVPFAPGAFLGPAWSISLEWQFYLIAPLLFMLTVRKTRKSFAAISLLTVIAVAASPLLPKVQFGAFLPMHAEFFFYGIVSFFVFKWLQNKPPAIGLLLPVTACSAAVLIGVGHDRALLPLCLWLSFIALLVDLQKPLPTAPVRCLGFMLNNKAALYLGKVSYSIYLSHMLVIALVQAALLTIAPGLSRPEHVAWLLAGTAIGTLGVSHLTYHFIEEPGIRLGKRLTRQRSKPDRQPVLSES